MEQRNLGKFISKLRKEKELTQEELGDILGVSSKTISKWECGNSIPDISILKEISKYFKISIEDLVDCNYDNKTEKETNIKKTIIIIALLLIIFITLFIFIKSKQHKYIPKETKKEINNCTVIRTYYIDNIGKSNDENYIYITIHEFQVEGTYTVILPKSISKDIKVDNSYEFTFKTTKEYTTTNTEELFNNGEIINLKFSDKEGLDRTSKFYCDKE